MSKDTSDHTSETAKELDEKETELEQEEETIDYFFNLVEEKLETSPTLEDLLLGGGYDSAQYKAEQDLLMTVNDSGLMEGTIAGVVTFVSLVAGPPLFRKLMPPKQYKLETTPQSKKLGSYLLMGARLGVQAAASLVIAAYTTSYFTDEDLMLRELAQAPLLEGRSVISDEFCATFAREYRRCHSQEYWNQVKSPYLQQLGVFVDNCAKRRSYEQDIRSQQGLLPNTPVPIPPPGVPANYPIDKRAIESDDNEGGVRASDSVEDMDADWADSFVTDRDDDMKRE